MSQKVLKITSLGTLLEKENLERESIQIIPAIFKPKQIAATRWCQTLAGILPDLDHGARSQELAGLASFASFSFLDFSLI